MKADYRTYYSHGLTKVVTLGLAVLCHYPRPHVMLAQSGSSLANEDLPPGIPSPAENGYYKPTNEVNSSFIVSKFVIEGKDYTGKILVSNPISFTGEILKKEIIINSIINKAEYKGYEFRLYEENGQLLLKSIVFTNNPEDIWVHKDTLTNYEAKWLNGFFDAKIFSYYSDIASAFTETGNEFAVMVGQLMQIPIVISESINAEQYYIDVKGGDLYFDIISQQNASYEYPIVMRHYITKEIEIVECSKHIPYYMQNVITLVGR